MLDVMVQKVQRQRVRVSVWLEHILPVVQVHVQAVQINQLTRDIQARQVIHRHPVHGHVTQDIMDLLRTVIRHVRIVALVIIARAERIRQRVQLGHMVHQQI